jgi:GTPase SAR1 family protein
MHEVFIDTKIPLGATWGNVIEESLGQADWMIALVSAKSATSAMVVTEIETAHRLNVERGRPILIPIRLGDIGALRYPLSAYMSRFQHAEWRTEADTPRLVARVVEALNAPPQRRSVASQRQALITRVRSDWITGVLDHSLQHVVRLELGLALDRSRVVSGMDALIQRPHQDAQPLRSGTTALDVFDDHHGQLLILGVPGAGKTTMLLELARDLLDRAEQDPLLPIPVVFNLSTWATEGEPLAEWMIRELRLRSDAPKRLAREWVTREQICPLLDGLDEVVGAQRQHCVTAINAYRSDNGWSPLIVCSREDEYEALAQRLMLPVAIVVQPLSTAQVSQFLENGGRPLDGVRAAVHRDREFANSMRTPLMLSVVALAYRNTVTIDTPSSLNDIFRAYVDTMFRRRVKDTQFSEAAMRSWLIWLAAVLHRTSSTVFVMDDMRPGWAFSRTSWWVHAGVLLVSLAAIYTSYVANLSILFLTQYRANDSLAGALKSLFGFAALFLAPAVLVAVFQGRRPAAVHRLVLRFPGIRSVIKAIVLGATFGMLAVGTLEMNVRAGNLVRYEFESMIRGWLEGNERGLIILAIAAANGLRACLTNTMADRHSSSGSAVSRSVAASALVLALGSVISQVTLRAGDTAFFDSMTNIGLFCVWATPILALNSGGYFVLWHYAARLAMWSRGKGPWHYARFLDNAVDRILLRRAGGGYLFVHRLLLEHLAQQAHSVPKRGNA